MKLLDAELEDRIEVTVEDDWNLRALANFSDAIEDTTHGRACGQCALRGQLINDSVRKRIGKRHAKLKDVRTCFFQCQRKIDSLGQTRIARANIGDKSFVLLRAEAVEAHVDPVVHPTG